MLVLLDTTVLTNFARVELASAPLRLWGDQVYTTAEALAEYHAGAQTAGLPRLAWKELRILESTSEEQALALTMSSRLGKGERACIAIAYMRGAIFATDDGFARRVARDYAIQITGTVGILKSCIQHRLLSQSQGQKALDEMIASGYHSPIQNLSDE